MKTISKLKSLTSLQTAETMALKAAKAAEASRKLHKAETSAKTKKPGKKKPSHTPSLEKEIRSIFNTMNSDIAQTTKAVMQQPAKGACCKGIMMLPALAQWPSMAQTHCLCC